MFLGDVRGEAIGRHPLPAEPAEGLTGRDVDALHSQQHEWLSVRTSSASGSSSSCSRKGYFYWRRSRLETLRRHPLRIRSRHSISYNRSHLPWLSLAGTRLGPYEVTAQIGAGRHGRVVWCATDTNLGRQVAIKVLPDAFAHDPERLARFEREAKTLASLNHPNIAIIHGLEKADGIRALVMELVEGPTLADRIGQGPIPSTRHCRSRSRLPRRSKLRMSRGSFIAI